VQRAPPARCPLESARGAGRPGGRSGRARRRWSRPVLRKRAGLSPRRGRSGRRPGIRSAGSGSYCKQDGADRRGDRLNPDHPVQTPRRTVGFSARTHLRAFFAASTEKSAVLVTKNDSRRRVRQRTYVPHSSISEASRAQFAPLDRFDSWSSGRIRAPLSAGNLPSVFPAGRRRPTIRG